MDSRTRSYAIPDSPAYQTPGHRVVALVAAAGSAGDAIEGRLRGRGVDVHRTDCHGAMAQVLFDRTEAGEGVDAFFVLDLRDSNGALGVTRRLADYDAVLNAYVMAGNPWPRTLCLVDRTQACPDWLQAHPNLRATLLADEVDAVVGGPEDHGWREAVDAALDACMG